MAAELEEVEIKDNGWTWMQFWDGADAGLSGDMRSRSDLEIYIEVHLLG